MRFTVLLSLFIICLLSRIVFAAGGDLGAGSGANGSENTPWLIEDFTDFEAFCGDSSYWASRYYTRLDTDLDLSVAGTYLHAPIAYDINADSSFDGTFFSGSFNGNNHTISNLTVDGVYYCGLFGRIGYGGSVSNLDLKNVSITGSESNVGSLCGYNFYGNITRCYASGGVSVSYGTHFYVGGLCGYNSNGDIIECKSVCEVTGVTYVGGLCGYNSSGSITECCAVGSVTGSVNNVGGLCGYNYKGSITDCYASGCVTGASFVGGVCGYNYSGSIAECYGVGSVTGSGSYVRGFCGYQIGSAAAMQNCFWDTQTSGQTEGYYSKSGTVTNVLGKTTANMQTLATFTAVGWDFSTNDGDEAVWKTLNGLYPVLNWQNIEIVTVPDFSGLTYDEAEELAESCLLGIVIVGYSFGNYEEGTIYSQSPAFGNSVLSETEVAIYISLGLPFSGGSGTVQDPYQISTAEDLILLGENAEFYADHFIMTSDLDLSGYSFSHALIAGDNNANSSFNGTRFTGNFNGNGYVISNLTVSGAYYCGLFGSIDSGGTVSNLGLEEISIIGSGSYVGSLCGYNILGSITSCYATGSVAGTGSYVGGVCGRNDSGSITSCYSTCSVIGEGDYVGGFCGYNSYGTISECYAIGNVTGASYMRGFCGYQIGGKIKNCFWDTQTSGQLVGYYLDSELPGTINNVVGKITAKMQTETTYTDVGWDFSTNDGDAADWFMSGVQYPHLISEIKNIIPDVAGMTYEDATAALVAANFRIEYIYTGSETIQAGHIIDQSLTAGYDFLCGSTIVLTVSVGHDYSGSGTEADPYQIATKYNLLLLGATPADYASYFVLTDDIDLAGHTFTQAIIASDINDDSTFDGTAFTGSFNGNGHTISNLTVCGTSYCGLFGYVGSGGSVSNLGLENVSSAGTEYYVGGLCGYNYYGRVTSCYATGSVAGSGNNVGGLCGKNENGSISECYSSGSVTGVNYVGGLCGYNKYGNITECYAIGSVTGTGSCVFGFCGYQYGSSAKMNDCFWDTQSSGQPDGYYLNTTYPGTVTNVVGKNTVEMKSEATFADVGWDFTTDDGDDAVWNMLDGLYPVFNWQNVSAVTVPDFSGLIYDQAEELAKNNLLAIIIAGYNFSNNEEGAICSQFPVSGSIVLGGTEVSIYISLGMPFSGGSGTELDPYQIASAEDLIILGENTEFYADHFILTSDIDLYDYDFIHAPIAGDADGNDSSSFEGTQFTGSFNGNGQIVSNLTVCDIMYSGLFGYIGSGGKVFNLKLENTSVYGSYAGSLCGYNDYGSIISCYVGGDVSGIGYLGGICGYNSGSITECYVTGSVTGTGDYSSVGGICGVNYSGNITECYATGSVTGVTYVGGLCGLSYSSGSITYCYAAGNVVGTGNAVGGLCGDNEYGSIISRCYATGSVTGSVAGAGYSLGGLCGYNHGSITECYATGSVTGTGHNIGGLCGINYMGSITECYATGSVAGTGNNVGGLCGRDYWGSIAECYSTGSVTGDTDIGGLCGYNENGSITECYAAGCVTGNVDVGGICGYNYGSITSCFFDTETTTQTSGNGYEETTTSDVAGLTTAEMYEIDTYLYSGWDFVDEGNNGTSDTWYNPKNTYPVFDWQRIFTIAYTGFEEPAYSSEWVGYTDTLTSPGYLDNHDGCTIVEYLPKADADELGFRTYYNGYNGPTTEPDGEDWYDNIGVSDYYNHSGLGSYQLEGPNNHAFFELERVKLNVWEEVEVSLWLKVMSGNDNYSSEDYVRIYLETDAGTYDIFYFGGDQLADYYNTNGDTWIQHSAKISNKATYADLLMEVYTGSGSDDLEGAQIDNISFVGKLNTSKVYVNQNASGDETGYTWKDAFKNLQDALSFVRKYPMMIHEVWVADGTYTPDIGAGLMEGDLDAAFNIPAALEIYGGFSGSETSVYQRDFGTYTTILSGNIKSGSSNSVIVVTQHDEWTLLDSVTIENAGTCLQNAFGYISLNNCTIDCQGSEHDSPSLLAVQSETELVSSHVLCSDYSDILFDVKDSTLHMIGDNVFGPGKFNLYSSEITGESFELTEDNEIIVANHLAGQEGAIIDIYGGQLSTSMLYDPNSGWYVRSGIKNAIICSETQSWIVNPSSKCSPGMFKWTGNALKNDYSENGSAHAIFYSGGILEIVGKLYSGDIEDADSLEHVFTGLLLKASVGGFEVKENSQGSLEFVTDVKVVPFDGYLVNKNEESIALSTKLIMQFTPEVILGDLQNFASPVLFTSGEVDFTLDSQYVSTSKITNSLTGPVNIYCGPKSILEVGAIDLMNSGTITAEGTIDVTGELTNAVINIVDAPVYEYGELKYDDVGGKLVVSKDASLASNIIYADGDQYMLIDPDNLENVNVYNNSINILFNQGRNSEKGFVLEARSHDYECSKSGSNCESGFWLTEIDDQFDEISFNNWVIDRIEVEENAKVNITNRLDYQSNSDYPDCIYVKELVLHPGAVVNASFAKVYFEQIILIDSSSSHFVWDGSNETLNHHNQVFDNGSSVVDIPLLGFSLEVISMNDTTSSPDNEFDLRVSKRQTNDESIKGYYVPGQIERILPVSEYDGVMNMQTNDNIIVAAKGSFASANEEVILVEFEYQFIKGYSDDAELNVYLSDSPNVGEDLVKLATIHVPSENRPGFGSVPSWADMNNYFATFSGVFYKQDLNFTEGIYIELELCGKNSRVLIDNWDPKIECASGTCGDFGGWYAGYENLTEMTDYLLLLSEVGLTSPASSNKGCLDIFPDDMVTMEDVASWGTPYMNCSTASSTMMISPHLVSIDPNSIDPNDLLPLTVSGMPAYPDIQINQSPQCTIYGVMPDGGSIKLNDGYASGRLLTDTSGTVYQLGATGDIWQYPSGTKILSPSVKQYDDHNVTAGLISNGDSPLTDIAFAPDDDTTVYVVPVKVDQKYNAAARLALSDNGYKVTGLYGIDPSCDQSQTITISDPNLSVSVVYEPDTQHVRELEVDSSGNLYVLSSHYQNSNSWLLRYAPESSVPDYLDLNDYGISMPTVMKMSGNDELYISTSADIVSGDPNNIELKLYGLDVSQWDLSTDKTVTTIKCPTPQARGISSLYLNGKYVSVITSITEDPSNGNLYLVGYSSPQFNADTNWSNVNIDSIFTTGFMAEIPFSQIGGTVEAVVIGEEKYSGLRLPMSVVWTGEPTEYGCNIADIYPDNKIDLYDFAVLSSYWLSSESVSDIYPMPYGDNITDISDLAEMVDCWLEVLK